MRKLTASALAALFLMPLGVSGQTEVTANAGYLSQYYYRGIPQKTSSANGGLDVAANMFSAGTWAADVGSGSEIDLYGGVSVPLGEIASLSVGGTGYFYTGQFDTRYLEANVGLALGPLSVDAAFGTHQADPEDQKYFYLGVTATAPYGLFATVGTLALTDPDDADLGIGDAFGDAFDNDLAYMYLEAGYGFSAGDLDFTISGLLNNANAALNEENDDGEPSGEFTLIFAVSKTFTIPTG